MRAEQLPLKGKHYGTTVLVADDELGVSQGLTVWLRGGEPSDEELQSAGVTRKQWNENALVPDSWGYGRMVPCRSADLIDWTHYQSEQEAEFCRRLVEAINR